MGVLVNNVKGISSVPALANGNLHMISRPVVSKLLQRSSFHNLSIGTEQCPIVSEVRDVAQGDLRSASLFSFYASYPTNALSLKLS